MSMLAAQFDLLYPILPPPSSFHRSLSLINILHLKLSLSVCFWKTQSATEGGWDRTKGIWSLAQKLQLSWAPLMPTPSGGVSFYQHCLPTLGLHTFHSFLSASIRNPSLSLQVTPESSVGGVLIRSSLPWPRLERERLTVCVCPSQCPGRGQGRECIKPQARDGARVLRALGQPPPLRRP